MSEDQATEDPDVGEESTEEESSPKKRSRRSLTPQTKGSCLLALFLMALVVTVWFIFWIDPDNVPWAHSMSWTRLILQILLVIAIPIFAYFTISAWLQTDKSRFPDIDHAWQAGLDALAEHGMSLADAPLFLIVGAEGEQVEQSLMAAAELDLRVKCVPEGAAPIHWYATDDGIYIVASEASWHSSLAHAYVDYTEREVVVEEQPEPEEEVQKPVAVARQTDTSAANDSAGPTGTIMLGQFVDQDDPNAEVAPPEEVVPTSTIQSKSDWLHETARATPPPQQRSEASASVLEEDRPSLMSSSDITEQTRRLNYLCEKVRAERQPICGINGILVLLPFAMLQEGSWTRELMQNSIKGDLRTIQTSFQLQSPVMILVTGMEKERGFRELVRRVGQNRAANQRFGSRFSINMVPAADEVRKFASHVCGAFEDWVYTLFREQQVLMRPGNTKLFGLLCKVRSTLKNQLGDLLAGCVGFRQGEYSEESPQLFAGCYFAATGKTPDRQAFVKAVFTKLLDSQEEVQWTENARSEASLVKTLVVGGRVVAVSLVVLLIGMVIWDVFLR